MWTKCANAGGKCMTWDEATNYCRTSNFAGYTDWRLPNRTDLTSLIDENQRDPALPKGHPFVGIKFNDFWSSSTVALETDSAWYLGIAYGSFHCSYKNNTYYVWLVRGGK